MTAIVRFTPPGAPARRSEPEGPARPVGFAQLGDRMPEGIFDVVARTAGVTRRARASEAARLARMAALADYTRTQVWAFLTAATEMDGVPPTTIRTHRLIGTGPRTVQAWGVPHWRCDVFPNVGRSLHLYLTPDGGTFESTSPPPLSPAHQAPPSAHAVEIETVLAEMDEIEGRGCIERLVNGLAAHVVRMEADQPIVPGPRAAPEPS